VPYPQFDRGRLKLRPLSERRPLVTAADQLPLGGVQGERLGPGSLAAVEIVAAKLARAKACGAPRVMFIGGHVVKRSVALHLIDMMERGYVSHLAANGAALVHDWELAMTGGTSEDVPETLAGGRFGLWADLCRLNAAVESPRADVGLGEAVGAHLQRCTPRNHVLAPSLLAAAFRCDVPATVHIGVGQDTPHMLPGFEPCSWGAASYRDFLVFAEAVRHLEGGCFLNVGSAVAGPEVFLKALSMARNVERQEGRNVCEFTAAVFDLQPPPAGLHDHLTDQSPRAYFNRAWKSVLCRSGARAAVYVQGDHRATLPALRRACIAADARQA
jgi:hypothetical protein